MDVRDSGFVALGHKAAYTDVFVYLMHILKISSDLDLSFEHVIIENNKK